MTWELKFYILAIILLVIGGLNWGSVGLFSTNALEYLNGVTFNSPALMKLIYVLVGISAIYVAFKTKDYLLL